MAELKLNAKLNFVIPVQQPDGSDIYIHATPLNHEVFKTYAVFLAKVYAKIHQEGVSVLTAPKVAAILMQEVAAEADRWTEIREGLLAEMTRLTNVLVLTEGKGWRPVPMAEAVRRKLIGPEDLAEVEGLLAFFILVSHMQPRDEVAGLLITAAKIWNARVTSSNSTEYAASLPTSTAVDSSAKAEAPKP